MTVKGETDLSCSETIKNKTMGQQQAKDHQDSWGDSIDNEHCL